MYNFLMEREECGSEIHSQAETPKRRCQTAALTALYSHPQMNRKERRVIGKSHIFLWDITESRFSN